MGRNWGMPWSPKKEEQEVPDPDITCSSSVVSDNHCHHESNHMVDLHHPKKDYFSFMDDMELDDDNGDSLFGIPDHGGDDDIKSLQTVAAVDAAGQVAKTDLPAAGRTAYWDFDFTSSDHDGGLSVNEDSGDLKPLLSQQQEQESILRVKLQEENNDDDDDDYQEMNMASLNLSLNYQHVLDAWSDRGTLWAHDNTALSLSNNPNNNSYMGEVPVMDDERSTRREASVMRYKEKRLTRLFSKKIRYQVRKLNADKRPRLKGRFVRKASDEGD